MVPANIIIMDGIGLKACLEHLPNAKETKGTLYYRMEENFGGGRGNVGEFGESPWICQTKTIQISTYH